MFGTTLAAIGFPTRRGIATHPQPMGPSDRENATRPMMMIVSSPNVVIRENLRSVEMICGSHS